VYVAVALSKLETGQTRMTADLQEVKVEVKEVKDAIREVSEVLAGVQRCSRSLAYGIREASPGVTAFACASPDDVTAWLARIGYEQYAHRMAPLGGSGVLLLTEGSLAAMGVAPEHCTPLLDEIRGLSVRRQS
jgi:hypothetical protein